MSCSISRLSFVDFEVVDRRWCDHLEDFHPHIARAHRLEAHLGLEHRDRPFEEVFFLAGVEAPGLDVFDALPAVGLVDTYIDLIAVDIGKLAFIRPRSEERRGGTACVGPWYSRWSLGQ